MHVYSLIGRLSRMACLAAVIQVIEAVNLLLKSATAVKKSKEDVQVSSHYFTCMHITVSSWMVPEVF